jgi:hypothetical protein
LQPSQSSTSPHLPQSHYVVFFAAAILHALDPRALNHCMAAHLADEGGHAVVLRRRRCSILGFGSAKEPAPPWRSGLLGRQWPATPAWRPLRKLTSRAGTSIEMVHAVPLTPKIALSPGPIATFGLYASGAATRWPAQKRRPPIRPRCRIQASARAARRQDRDRCR